MSTRIFDANKIPSTNMRVLIAIAQKMQQIEIPALINSAGAKYSLRFSDTLKAAILGLNERGNLDAELSAGRYRKLKAFNAAVSRFVGATLINDTIISDPEDEKIFFGNLQEILDGIPVQDFKALIELVEDVARCREVSFLPTNHGFTLMKWYNLTEETRKWVSDHFREYEYQNSTDGPPLSELDPELHNKIEEEVDDFTKYAINEFDGDKETLMKVINKMKNSIQYGLAYSLYRRRDEVWEEAIGNVFNYAQASLSFSLFSGWENSEKRVCSNAIHLACQPADKQDPACLERECAAKAKEDAWREKLINKHGKAGEE